MSSSFNLRSFNTEYTPFGKCVEPKHCKIREESTSRGSQLAAVQNNKFEVVIGIRFLFSAQNYDKS